MVLSPEKLSCILKSYLNFVKRYFLDPVEFFCPASRINLYGMRVCKTTAESCSYGVVHIYLVQSLKPQNNELLEAYKRQNGVKCKMTFLVDEFVKLFQTERAHNKTFKISLRLHINNTSATDHPRSNSPPF